MPVEPPHLSTRLAHAYLPEPLPVESLRSHRAGGTAPSFSDYVQQIRRQFLLNDDEAFELIDCVVRVTREAAGQYAWSPLRVNPISS